VDIDPGASLGYESTVRARNLVDMEESVRRMYSPLWPEDVLPPIDRDLAALGQPLYERNCLTCHVLIDRTSPTRTIEAHMVPVATIGTDPTAAMNMATRTAVTGRLAGTKLLVHSGPELGAEEPALSLLANAVIGAILDHPLEALASIVDREKMAIRDARALESLVPDLTPPPPSYKGRPLNGVWATAPFLHNGSVPSLAELLRSPEDRSKTFYLGHREYDPVDVGYVNQSFPGAFPFDTTLHGNSNAGHNYGTRLSAEEKLQLIEYIKTL
jgi:hypothetical protein